MNAGKRLVLFELRSDFYREEILMETVFDALKAMGKATSAELAARLDISREEVLNELWELKRNGVVDKRVTSGFWLEKVNPG